MNISADTSRRRRTIELRSLTAPLLMPVLSCSMAACLSATSSLPAVAAPQTERDTQATRLPSLAIGRAQTVSLPPGASFRIQAGGELVSALMQHSVLSLTGLRTGDVVLAIDAPNRAPQLYKLRVREAMTPIVQADAQVQTRPEGVATSPQINDMGATGAPVGTTSTQAPGTSATGTSSAAGAPTGIEGANGNGSSLSPLPPISPAPQRPLPSGLSGTRFPDTDLTPNVGPSVSAARLPSNSAAFPTSGTLPRNVQQVARAGSGGRAAITVTQGLARILAFPSNILAVFFSDTNVMDARAINARAVAVTGLGTGQSTLAVFTARYSGDAIGRANIYRISVGQGSNNLTFPSGTTPTTLENAINAAIGDPRVRVVVSRSPRGNAFVTLSGTVRDANEVQAASTIAGIYVPPQQVISRIVVSPTALSLQESLNEPNAATQSSEQILQGRLRQLTGNETIELIPLPTGLGFKATVDSPQDAEAILNLVPVTADRPILPFIVIRGASGTSTDPSYYQRTVLTSEDQQSTRALQSVTGVRTVYVVRTAKNGLAVYGTVRNRIEYEAVRRYARILPQVPEGTGPGSTSDRSNFPAGVNSFPVGVQLFVRILDPAEQVVRRVNVETSIVEISRTAARNLGVEVGSATVLSEGFTPGTPPTSVAGPNGTTTTGGTPSVRTRTIDPTFNSGSFTLGNGFAGLSGGLGNLNPFRARINALYSNGNARVLSRPNLTAVEGAEAQITIGGSRPVPSTAISGSGGAVGQSVEFRRFGIILTMRPTVTDDDTIILQIRVDVSNLDPTSGINLNGAFVPGESVRSVDTTLTLREGDTIVMGGLITNDRRRNTSRIPVLSQIPILGALFKSKQFQDNQTELAIFMSPQILRQQASPGTLVDVARVPALPALAGNQQRNEIFSFGGAGGSSGQ